MDHYLDDYNVVCKTPMPLVLFRFAIEHVSRISRILKQPKGHALLVGISGSGRQSAAKLAAHMADYRLYQIEITKTYTTADWREDVRKMMKMAGFEGQPTVFLFGDNQIKDESFLEDVSMILNTADVPNLFEAEEKAEIIEKVETRIIYLILFELFFGLQMQLVVRDESAKIDTTAVAMYNFFLERVRSHLHVVLCMSPVGDAFRNRLRKFPSLINCCTIDWFQARTVLGGTVSPL